MLTVEAELVEVLTEGSDGFSSVKRHFIDALFQRAKYRPRQPMEVDTNFRQLIPYVVVVNEGAAFTYRRGKRTSEARLTGAVSIGLGGHIEFSDDMLLGECDPLEAAAEREVSEEIQMPPPTARAVLGLLNDASTPVGRVHVGILYVWEVSTRVILPKEQQVNALGFRARSELDEFTDLETWSRMSMPVLATSGYI